MRHYGSLIQQQNKTTSKCEGFAAWKLARFGHADRRAEETGSAEPLVSMICLLFMPPKAVS